MKYTDADERVAKLLGLEPLTASDFHEIERVLLGEIDKALSEQRISHSIALKRRLAELRRRRGS